MASYVDLTRNVPSVGSFGAASWGQQVNDNFTALNTHYFARMSFSTTFTPSGTAVAAVPFDTLTYDPFGCIVGLKTSSAAYVCPVTGYYRTISAMGSTAVGMVANAVNYTYIYLTTPGFVATEVARSQLSIQSANSNIMTNTATTLYCVAGSKIQTYWSTSVGSLGTIANGACQYQATYLITPVLITS